MTKRQLTIILALGPALALGACGGGSSYGGDLYIDGSQVEDTPSLSRLRDGLQGMPSPQPYVENPLLQQVQ